MGLLKDHAKHSNMGLNVHVNVRGKLLSYNFDRQSRQATCVYNGHFFTLYEVHPLVSQDEIVNYVRKNFGSESK